MSSEAEERIRAKAEAALRARQFPRADLPITSELFKRPTEPER